MKMKTRVGAAIAAAVILAGAVTCFANFSDVSELFGMHAETFEEQEAAADEPISGVSAQSDSGTGKQRFDSTAEIGYKEKHYRTNMTKAYVSKNASEESVDPQSGDLTICQTDYSVPLTNGRFDIKRIFLSNLACADYSAGVHFNGAEKLESYYSSVYHMGDGWRFSFPMLEIIPIDENYSNPDGTSIARIMYHSESGAVYSITPLIEDAGSEQEAPKVKFSIQNHGAKDIEVKYNYGNYNSKYNTFDFKGIEITHKKEGVTYKFGKYGYISEIIYNNAQNGNADTVSFVYRNLSTTNSGMLSAEGLDIRHDNAKYAVDHIDIKTRGTTQTISFQYDENSKLLTAIKPPNKKTTIAYGYTKPYTKESDYKNDVLNAVYDTDGRMKYLFNTGKVSVKRIYTGSGKIKKDVVDMNTIESIVYARENRASVYEYKMTEDAATKWQYANVIKHCDHELAENGGIGKQTGPETTYEYPSGQELLETYGLYTETFERPIGSEESFWEQNTYAGNNTNGTFDLKNGYMQSWRRMHSEVLSKGEYGDFVINTTIRFVEGTISDYNSAGVVFGVSEFNRGNNNFNGYYARISPENHIEGDENKNTIALFKMHSNSQSPNADTEEELLAWRSFSEAGLGESCRDDVSYPMKIVKEGNLVKIYVIDMTNEAITYKDDNLVNVSGKVGLRTFQRRAAYTSFKIATKRYEKEVTVRETDGTRTVETMYRYDNDSNMTEKRVDYGDYAVAEQYAYDKRRLPTEIRTSEYAVKPNRKLLWEKCERYTYDDYGNVIEYKNPFADMSEEDGAQAETVKCKYDGRWCLPTEKLEMMNETTAVKTTYTLSEDGALITGETVTEISGGAEKTVSNTSYTYDEYGRITSETITGENSEDVSQKIYDYNYSNGQFTTQITTGNITRTVTTDAYSGNVVYESDGTHPVTYEYDVLDRLVKITYGEQLSEEEKKRGIKNTVEYTYDNSIFTSDGKITYNPVSITRTDENSCATKTIYDSHGRPIEEIRGKEGQTVTASNTYDLWGRLSSSTDEGGNVTSYTYDNMNRLVEKTTGDYAEEYAYSYNLNGAATGRSEKTVTKTYLKAGKSAGSDSVTYDVLGRTIARTDGEGNKTETGYDSMGNTISVTDGNGNKTVFEYDALGRLTSSVKDDGSFTRYSYNAFDKVKRKENGLTETNYEYNGAGNVTEENQCILGENKGFYKKYYYTPCGNVNCVEKGTYIGKEETLSEKEDISYGDRDRVIQRFKYINDENGQSVYYLYDNRGSVISEKEYLDGNIYYNTLREYDFDGRITKETVRKEKVENGETIFEAISETCCEYDKRGNLTKKTSVGISEGYEYDAEGRIVSKTAPNGLVTSFEYDGRGNAVKESYMRGEEEIAKSCEYDLAGRLTTETDPEGNKTRYFYDGAGNIVKTIGPRYQGGNNAVLYEYDAKNRLVKTTAVNNGTETVIEEVTYDAGDRVTKRKSGEETLVYEYDAAGNITKTTDGEGNEAGCIYDGSGRVLSAADANGNVTTSTYFLNGLPKSVTYPDGKAVIYYMGDNPEDPNEYNFDATGKYKKTAKDRDKNKTVTEYNIWGRPTIVTYPDGKTEEFTYDALGRMVTSTDRCGTVTSYTYDNNGNITEKSLMNNGTEIKESYSYSLDNLLISYTDPCGNTTSYSYDKAGKLTKKNNPNGTAETYVYDGDVVASQNINGITTSYTYDVTGRVLTETTGDRNTAYQYDPAGNVTIKINPDGGKTEYFYDKAGRLTAQTFGESVTQYGYDGNGNVKTEIKNTSPVSQTAYEYDAMNNLVKMNDNGIETAYEYDNLGRCVKVTLDGAVSRYRYDVMGNMTAEQNANGQITLYKYDDMGRVIETADGISDSKIASLTWEGEPADNYKPSMSYEYDKLGNKVSETNALGKANRYVYDNCGRVLSVTYPDENSVSYTYDGCGNLMTETDAKGNVTSYEYVNNMLSRKYDSLGTIKSYTYNDIGEVSSETDGEGNVTSYEYDNCGRLIGVTMPEEVTTKYSYDKEGNMLSQTDGEGHQTTYAYYPFGMLQSVTNAEGEEESYEYDARGNMTAKTDGNGEVVNYTYDAKNNLISMSNGDILISYKYDALGNRTGMEDESGAYVYTYDCGNRLTKVTKDGAAYVSYSYDVLGNVTSINGTAYTYDECNRMVSAGNVSYTYDENGNLSQTTYPVGTTVYEYDSRNRVASVENTVGGNVLSSYAYSYYNNNLEKTKTDNGKTTEYVYDGAGRIKTVSDGIRTAVYTYDKAGNRTTLTETADKTETVGSSEITYEVKVSSYLYSDSNRLLSVSELYKNSEDTEVMRKIFRYVFDKSGNQISSSAEYLFPKEEATEEYAAAANSYDSVVEVSINEYNGLNQLVNTTNIKDGNRSFASYVYNGDGLRVQKTVDGKTTDYTYSGSYVIEETGKTYLRGLSYHAVTQSGEIYYYFCNSHGDVTSVVDSSKVTAATYDYDEFGNLTEQTGNLDNDIRYAGEFYDSESENYYLRSRYYEPTVGRFTQQDSFLGVDDNPLSLNRYTYCHNNPIMYVDPSGHEARTYSRGDVLYGYDTSQFTSSEQDYQSSVWMGQYQRGEINNEQFMQGMNSIGISMSVIGGRTGGYSGGNSQPSNFIPAEHVDVIFNTPLSMENSVNAIKAFDEYNSGMVNEEELMTRLNKLSAMTIKVSEIDSVYYEQSSYGEEEPYCIINGVKVYPLSGNEVAVREWVEQRGGTVKAVKKSIIGIFKYGLDHIEVTLNGKTKEYYDEDYIIMDNKAYIDFNRLMRDFQAELISKSQLEQLGWNNVSDDTVKELNRVLWKYNITSLNGLRHFISQVSYESSYGTALTEKYNGNPTEYFKKVDGGEKYRGAGYIQLTNKYTYQQFADDVGDQEIVNQGYSYVAKNYAWEAAGWFWANYKNGLKELADNGATVEEVTKIVNGGQNGVSIRKEIYNKAVNIITRGVD